MSKSFCLSVCVCLCVWTYTGLTGAHLLGYCIQHPTNRAFKVTVNSVPAAIVRAFKGSKMHLVRFAMPYFFLIKTNSHCFMNESLIHLLLSLRILSQGLCFFTESCHLHLSCSPWGPDNPWHRAQMWYQWWSQRCGYREEECPNSFTGVGKYPPLHQALCLFKWLLLVWDQWIWEKLERSLEWTIFFPQESQQSGWLIHPVLPFQIQKLRRDCSLITIILSNDIKKKKISTKDPTGFWLLKKIIPFSLESSFYNWSCSCQGLMHIIQYSHMSSIKYWLDNCKNHNRWEMQPH